MDTRIDPAEFRQPSDGTLSLLRAQGHCPHCDYKQGHCLTACKKLAIASPLYYNYSMGFLRVCFHGFRMLKFIITEHDPTIAPLLDVAGEETYIKTPRYRCATSFYFTRDLIQAFTYLLPTSFQLAIQLRDQRRKKK